MEPEKSKSKIAVFSFSLSIISLILAVSAIVIMFYLQSGVHYKYSEDNTGVVIGYIPAIQLLIISAAGILLSFVASIIVFFQKTVIKKYACYGLIVNLFTILIVIVAIMADI